MDSTNIKELEERARKRAEAQEEAQRQKLAQLRANREREAARYVLLPPISEPLSQPEIRPKLQFKARVEFSRPIDGARHEVLVMHADVAGFNAEECFENLVAQFKKGLIAFPKFDHTYRVKDGKLKATSHPRELSEPGNLIQGEEKPRSRTLKFFGK
jgi:hypothetical protein